MSCGRSFVQGNHVPQKACGGDAGGCVVAPCCTSWAKVLKLRSAMPNSITRSYKQANIGHHIPRNRHICLEKKWTTETMSFASQTHAERSKCMPPKAQSPVPDRKFAYSSIVSSLKSGLTEGYAEALACQRIRKTKDR
eukprot:3104382-Amphidinium_carterae.1